MRKEDGCAGLKLGLEMIHFFGLIKAKELKNIDKIYQIPAAKLDIVCLEAYIAHVTTVFTLYVEML